ncbi:hypothetical protein PENARI_c030G02380 [Penicillium arizonense]|uniref:Zn(2)-C6 fungal-type domain-containing protein n=1 Tax=Penicillium arizonense TaxID=1835702 RepID=A0A1F5L4X6_PENAI|nr:hypothetical protein PENARI_c030G02380 [Penicillium arizonense]OGE48284.1 hypothetical protein PENARI_c030G02380 [Penicillium arizonense]
MTPPTHPLPYSSVGSREGDPHSATCRSRSRRGCQTCRDKKVKCDEGRPNCARCTRLNRHCDYTPRPRKPYSRQTTLTSPSRQGDGSHTAAEQLGPQNSEVPLTGSTAPLPGSQPKDPISEGGSTVSPESPTGESQHVPTHGLDSLPLCPTSTSSITLSPACAILLSESDYEAIHCLRFVISPSVDTKSPEFSGPALIWTLSQRSPLVLHMACALGSLQLCQESSHPSTAQRRKSEAVEHYSAALRLLATAIQDLTQMSDLDFILAALWLMIALERTHGDGTGAGLSTHLRGAALLLQGRLRNLRSIVAENGPQFDEQGAEDIRSRSEEEDGGAALNGIEAAFNDLLGEAMSDLAENEALSRLRGFNILQKHAILVYHEAWGASYPQSELIEDLQCSQIFCLQAEAGQLRYMLSKLAPVDECPNSSLGVDKKTLAYAIEDVGLRYKDLLTAASLIELPKEGPQRTYVLNVRAIVPFYHAIVLCFYSLVNSSMALNVKQTSSLREIMTLGFRTYSDQGDQAMGRIAWPLFVVALESDDMIHRAWVLERFEVLGKAEKTA